MDAPLVLMYHGVDDLDSERDAENLFVPVRAFARQLEHLRSAGYTFLSEIDYVAWLDGRPLDGPSVLLTFDDGYVSVLHHAAPLLGAHGIPAVCFVCPGMLGKRSTWMPEPSWHELMTRDQLAELADAGISLGVHGYDHTALETLKADEMELQTKGAAAHLRELLGVEPRTFAYPYGTHSVAARQAVHGAGFEAAFAIYEDAGRWALPRVDINAVDTPRTFALKLTSAYPRVRKVLSVAPPVRRAAHLLAGRARR